MDSEVNLTLKNDEEQQQYVQIPIKKKDFGDFISNLLGQAETIEQEMYGDFNATYEWLIHLHHLLDVRIKQQTHSDLVDFSAVVSYTDGPDRKLSTIDSFLSFNEAKMFQTRGIKIVWTYLIAFPGKTSPEKQEITLKLSSSKRKMERKNRDGNQLISKSDTGTAFYSIAHTERTWGDDIQTIFSNEIESIFIKEKWYNKILDYTMVFLALGVFLAGIMLPEYLDQIIKEKQIAEIYSSIVANGNTVEALSVDEKLNLALKLIDPSNELHRVEVWFRALSLILGMVLAVMTMAIFDPDRRSFIQVTKTDQKAKENYDHKNKWAFIKSSTAYIAAISASVIGNIVYYYLSV